MAGAHRAGTESTRGAKTRRKEKRGKGNQRHVCGERRDVTIRREDRQLLDALRKNIGCVSAERQHKQSVGGLRATRQRHGFQRGAALLLREFRVLSQSGAEVRDEFRAKGCSRMQHGSTDRAIRVESYWTFHRASVVMRHHFQHPEAMPKASQIRHRQLQRPIQISHRKQQKRHQRVNHLP